MKFPMIPVDLACNWLANPLGIDDPVPRLGWRFEGVGRARGQSAWQLMAASSAELLSKDCGDLWDSGKVCDDRCVAIRWGGVTLRTGQEIHWKVRAWDEAGNLGPWSSPARFEMGVMSCADWRAKWISAPFLRTVFPGYAPDPSPIFRRSLELEELPAKARIMISGLGYHYLTVNGRKVGDDVLSPLFTAYDKRVLYATYDLTPFLRKGANALGVMLGTGWFNCHTAEVWDFQQASWRDRVRLACQIVLHFTDGRTSTVISDTGWKASTGPIVFDALRNGEHYDARKEIPGWDLPGFDDSTWKSAEVVPAPGGILRAQTLPMKIRGRIAPRSVKKLRSGVHLVDMGRNMTGCIEFTVQAPAGAEITLRHAEKLGADGDIDQSNINVFIRSGDCQTDRYICRGGAPETWCPRFTYHGFQYVQVTGWPGSLKPEDIRGLVIHSDFGEAGKFSCSNADINRLHELTCRSYLSNFQGIPTDCPHREKNGWTGDALIAAETGLFNWHAAPAYEKWLDDFDDMLRPSGQLPGIVPTAGWGYNWGSGPAWDSAFVQIPWLIRLYTGDPALLVERYEGLKRYFSFMTTMATDDICSFGLGDWCPPEHQGGYGGSCPTALTSTGYYFANAHILSETAKLAGKADDAANFAALATRIRDSFNRRFYLGDGLYEGNCQTSQGCALFWRLAPDGEDSKVFSKLVELIEKNNGLLDYGILGAKYVPNVLADRGRADLALRQILGPEYPSWGNWLRMGAESLWESWKGETSRNHIMFGDIGAWFYKVLAGISPCPDFPGFKRSRLAPHLIDGVDSASGETLTPYGRLASSWRRTDEGIEWNVSIPPNTCADLIFPSEKPAAVTEGGRPLPRAEGISEVRVCDGRVKATAASGNYSFAANR